MSITDMKTMSIEVCTQKSQEIFKNFFTMKTEEQQAS